MAEVMIDNVEYDLSLIAEVEQNPILYDSNRSDFRCAEFKMATWKEIAQRLRKSSDDTAVRLVKNRWKSLRDSLVKETRCQNSSHHPDKKRRKNWRYSSAMAFLLPFLGEPNPAKGIRYKKRGSDTDAVESVDNFYITKEDLNQIVDEPIETISHDEIDAFFRGIAEMVKKLTPENQVKIQKEVVNMVLDVKLWEIKDSKTVSDKS